MNYKKTIFIIFVSIFLSAERKANAQADTFHYVSNNIQTWKVPGCVTQVTVKLWAGGGGGDDWYGFRVFDLAGGSGAYYEGVLSGLTPGTILGLYVPSGGKYSDTLVGGAGGWPGGGKGGYHTYVLSGLIAGGGGGYAAIKINGTYFVVAGSGGGAGSFAPTHGFGGSGGSTTGGNGGYGSFYGGSGGTISAGGKPGFSSLTCDSGTSGVAFMGGIGGGLPPPCDSEYSGGGGGGGYYGGGGGGDWGEGGGGGSSYPAVTFSSGGITFTPISNLQGNVDSGSIDALAPGSPSDTTIGMGGCATNGGNGLIIIIGAYPSLTSIISGQINPLCGVCNGSLTVTASAGRPPYTYSWSPTGQTTQTATGLCQNTYTVTVSDSCGNTSTAKVVLTANPITVTANVTANLKCNGICTGIATATVGIGSPPYTYTWAPSGGTKAIATGLCIGIYTLTVADINGCTGTATATITEPSQLIANISPLTYPLCNGGTGTATADLSGGVSPYTYLWTPGGQTNALATGLSAKTYTVTIKDNNGCTATAAATITQPTQVTATINVTANILCNGGTGSATVSAGGGISPYTYLWNPSAQTNALATSLSAGSYTVNVTDNNACTATASITITQPAVLTATMSSIIHSSCNLSNGAATVSVTGGTLPYFYIWSPGGQTKAQATDLGVGTYTVDVTDHNGCTASATATITQPTLVTAAITATTNITCYNGNNGAATVKANGGSLPYTYLWTPSNYTTASPNNLFALTYTVTVTDANGCTVTETATLTQPAQLAVIISEPKTICKDSTGNIYGNSTGGTSPYTYSWSGGNISTTSTATITPIATNNYSVVVTDDNGCTASTNIILKYGPDLFVTVTGKNSVCAGYTTTICASVTGGQGGNFYVWSPSNNTNACITVTPGITSTYTVQVVDGCGATTTANTTLYTNPSPVINMTADVTEGCVPLCIQFRNSTTLSKGNITQYIWNFGNKDTAQSMSPVYCYANSGSYNVSLTAVTDSGCSATLDKVNMITVYKHPNAAFTYSPQDVNIETPEVQFTDESTDASGIAYWLWNFGDLSNSTSILQNPIHTYKDTGSFCADLIVMDTHGCTDTATNCLVIGSAFKLYIPSAFTPNGDGMDDIFVPVGKYIRNFEMYIFDRWGIELYHSTNINEGWNGTANGGTSISQEDVYVYKIMVTDAEGTQHSYIGKITLIK